MGHILKRKDFMKIYEDVSPEKVESESEQEKKEVSWEQRDHELKIPEYKRKSFDKFVRKLKRFAKTIGFPDPVVTEKGKIVEYVVSIKTSTGFEEQFASFNEQESLNKLQEYQEKKQVAYVGNRKYDQITLNVVDDIRPLEDWEILGTIDYKDGLVKPAPGKEIPMHLIANTNLTGVSHCDHCNKTLNRNKTVFVQNISNEIKQIGGTCTKYYLGLDYLKIISYIESIHEMESIFQYEGGWRMGEIEEKTYSVHSIIKYYIWMVNTYNTHTSKKAASAYNDTLSPEDDQTPRKQSTGDKVADEVVYCSYPPDLSGLSSKQRAETMDDWIEKSEEFNKNINSVSDADLKDILDFIDVRKGESNFMLNVFNKVVDGAVPWQVIRYITGACSFYFGIKIAEKLKLEKEDKAKQESTSKHIGTVGEKYGFKDLEIKRINRFDTQFGFSNIYTMEDTDGNIFTKFGTIAKRFISETSEEKDEVIVGTIISFTADVREHKEFRGINQTVLGRMSKYNPKIDYNL